MTESVQQTESLVFFTLLQLIVMIGSARVVNNACRYVGQPGVVGEILAGLLLGPSFFGYFFPEVARTLFGQKASTPVLVVISQIGLILLMFQIGTDFEFGHLKQARNLRAVLALTLVSVGMPFGLGMAIGHLSSAALAPTIDPAIYSLFFGVGLAITAVPILGRILRQYGLTRTEVGVVAISAAALNDVIGWLLLAGVSAYAAAKLSGTYMAVRIGGVLLFAAVIWFILRPLADWSIARQRPTGGELRPNLMASILCLMLAMAICTYKLGIFAIFGGFAAGLLFHRHEFFVEAWRRNVGRFVMVFFLPVFFTFTGLRGQNVLGLSTATDMQWLLIVLATAILGKIVPVYAMARVCGFDRHQSLLLGALMNTRALMELIVINIGYDMGFIPQKVFTMLVIMAVVTTAMTGPLLRALLTRTGHEIPVGMDLSITHI